MARKPYVPLNQNPECEVVPEEKQCGPGDRNVRAMVSADPGNSIQQRPDGLYAPAIVYRENTSVINEDGSIEVEEGTSAGGFRQFTVGTRISLESGNILEVREDGLFASVPGTAEQDLILMDQGSLTYSPLVPGEGTITYPGVRNVIRVLNGLTRIVLPVAEEFTAMEEVYLVQDGQRTMPLHLVWPAGVTVDNVAGPGSRTFGPGSSIHLLRHVGQQWLVLSGGGVNEAPFDDQPYTRRNGIWVQQHAQVLPAMVLDSPEDVMALDLVPAHFNRIVEIVTDYTSLDMKRQHVVAYQDHFEATFVKQDEFLLNVPMGVTVNGFAGPLAFRVEGKPKGCVLKRIGTDRWLLLGSAQQDGSVEPLPPITTLEFPGSGSFRGVARLMDGTILYDMTGNTNMFSSVHSIKNLVIAAVVIDEQTPYLDMKDQVYLSSYRTGLTDNLSPLENGDLVSYRDLISLLLMGQYEDIAVMISSLLGSGDHDVFTQKMNDFVANIENPLISSFYGAAISIADPVGISNAYKLADWLQHFEENYEIIRNMSRLADRTFAVFGANAREVTITNSNPYLVWSRVDYGKINDLVTATFPFSGLVQKLEMPADIPVYVSMHQFSTEVERHMAFTSALMGLEDDFPFLTAGTTDFDLNFSNVSLLIGNSISLVDRSNIQNEVFNSPTGYTHENRDTKGWIRSHALNGTSGYITVYDNPSLRLGDADFTLEMFLRGNGINTNMILFAKDGDSEAQRSYMMRFSNTDLQFIYMLDGASAMETWTIPYALKNTFFNGARRHLCLQRNGDDLAIYVNGRVIGTRTLPTDAAFQDCAMPFNIGCNGDPLYLPNPTSGWYGRFKLDNLRLTKGITRYDMAGFPVRTTPFKTGSGA